MGEPGLEFPISLTRLLCSILIIAVTFRYTVFHTMLFNVVVQPTYTCIYVHNQRKIVFEQHFSVSHEIISIVRLIISI